MAELFRLLRLVDWNAIAALAGVIAAIAAIAALIAESRRHRFSQAIDLLLRFEDRFESDNIRRARAMAARGIRAKRLDEADDILDFFETLGLLVEREALDVDLVWGSFSYWLGRYMFLTKAYVTKVRRDDPSVWRNLANLHDSFTAISSGDSPPTAITFSDAELADFLDYEESQFELHPRDSVRSDSGSLDR